MTVVVDKNMIFRYPGGKSRILPALGPHLERLLAGQLEYHEPFVGGGSVLHHVAKHYPNLRLFVNDLDSRIAAFWRVVAKPESVKELADKIGLFVPTVDALRNIRKTPPLSDVDAAFRAVVLNRCCFSGILDGTPIGGWNQTSEWTVGCRYNGPRLKAEILALAPVLEGRLTVFCEDGVDYLLNCEETAACYIDPPYVQEGDRLYSEKMVRRGHIRLSRVLARRKNWVLSYDNVNFVHALYAWAAIHPIDVVYSVRGRKKTLNNTRELIITPSENS